jgi:hypothetical protein
MVGYLTLPLLRLVYSDASVMGYMYIAAIGLLKSNAAEE